MLFVYIFPSDEIHVHLFCLISFKTDGDNNCVTHPFKHKGVRPGYDKNTSYIRP